MHAPEFSPELHQVSSGLPNMADLERAGSPTLLDEKYALMAAEAEYEQRPVGAIKLEVDSEEQSEEGPRVPAIIYAVLWMSLSSFVVLSNKYILYSANFKYPILLAAFHTTFATIATQFLAKTSSWVDGRKSVQMTPRIYLQAVVPIGLAFSGSIVLSNYAFLHLSVAFIEMLKAASPIITLLFGLVHGLETFNLKIMLSVSSIAIGLAVASYGEIKFSTIGFVIQIGALLLSAAKIIWMQKLLHTAGGKMDPMTSLYYLAPVCSLSAWTAALVVEVPHVGFDDIHRVGLPILTASTMVAFCLQMSEVFLIHKTSGLGITLFGVLKSLVVVVASIAIWHTPMTVVQATGYGMTLCALLYYKLVAVSNGNNLSESFGSMFKFGGILDGIRNTKVLYLASITLCLLIASLIFFLRYYWTSHP